MQEDASVRGGGITVNEAFNAARTRHTVDCPASLLSFPADIDSGANFGGFVCFDQAAEGGTLLVLSGSIRIMDIDARPGYQLADGTVIDPPN